MGRSVSVQEHLEQLRAAGHLEGANESTVMELADRMCERRDLERVAVVRRAMLDELHAVRCTHDCVAAIDGAATLADLWAARDAFAQSVESGRPAERARQILEEVTQLFLTGTVVFVHPKGRLSQRRGAHRALPVEKQSA